MSDITELEHGSDEPEQTRNQRAAEAQRERNRGANRRALDRQNALGRKLRAIPGNVQDTSAGPVSQDFSGQGD